MQVVDLRHGRRTSPPTLSVWASPGAELVHIAALLAHGDDDSFDVGAARVAAIRDTLPAELVDAVQAETPKLWMAANRLLTLVDEPGTAEDLLALLADDPAIAWRTFMEELCSIADVDPDVLDAHRDGELAADDLRGLLDGRLDDWRADLLDVLLDDDAFVAFGERLHSTLSALHEAVADTLIEEAMGPIRREVAARRQQLAEGVDVLDVVVEASNGYELATDLPVDHILLLPSYWFRPWLLFGRNGGTEVLTSPVPDEHLVLPSQAPPPTLVKLCKATADEGRLRLLRRMSSGPIQLADAMEELDVAKTTAHHHLAILRQAGLVVVRGEGRSTTYGLRVDPAATAADALRGYLGPGAVSIATRDGTG